MKNRGLSLMRQSDRFHCSSLRCGLCAVAAGVCALGVLAERATGQWTVTELPPGQVAVGVSGSQFVGSVGWSPALWNGLGANWTDLTPAGGLGAVVSATDGAQQVGWAETYNGIQSACLWSGSAESFVNLHPDVPGAHRSEAYAAHGGQQVGAVDIWYTPVASLWSGSAGSWVNLQPAGALMSEARGVYAGRQVGTVLFSNYEIHAVMWNGTAESWTSLHPGMGATSSGMTCIHGDEQGGYVEWYPISHAALWRNTAASWVDLHPAQAVGSLVLGVHNGVQAGFVEMPTGRHASVWRGTAASWQDLHALLPSRFVSSAAWAVSGDATTTYVVGEAYDPVAPELVGVVWSMVHQNTAAGQQVAVAPIDTATGLSPASITFSNVSTAGLTTVTRGISAPDLPAGFRLDGTYYDVSTTASYGGLVQICFDYSASPAAQDPAAEAMLQLYHYENGRWKNITTSIDPQTNTICGRTTSLSPFAIARFQFGATAPQSLEQLSAAVASLNTQFGISNSLDAKLHRARAALSDANNNNNASAVSALSAFVSACQAQSGTQLPPAIAAFLERVAQRLIDELSNP